MKNWIGMLALVAVIGCGEGGDSDGFGTFVRGDAVVDGNVVRIDGPCQMSSTDDTRGFERVEPSSRIGVVVVWSESAITGPQSVEHDTLGDLQIWITRPHPTDAGELRVSSANDGSVTFEEISYASGGVIRGTFENVVMTRDDPDDTIDIRIDSGEFLCKVP